MTDSTPKVHRRHHGGRPWSCRLRSRREQLRSPTPHDKTSYRSRIRNSRTNRQEVANIPLLVGNAKRQTTDLDCLIDLARRQMMPASKRGMARIGKAVPATVSEGSGGSMPVSHRLVRLGPSRRGRCFADCGLGRHLGGFRVALDMAFGALSKYDFCFVRMGFPEVGSLGMEANGVGSKRILESTDQAKSPHRILVRSLLKSRNKLREKYRELRAECKRWRNQAAAVERSRSTWRKRALAHEASAQEDRAARAKLESQLQQLREQSERREVESAECARDWPPWKGRKKRGSEPTG